MKYLNLLLIPLVLLVGGCGLLPTQNYVTERDIARDDGTVIPAGTAVYTDEAGEPTVDPKSPSGEQRAPWRVTDADKAAKFLESAEKTAGSLPFGLGAIAGPIAAILAAGGIAAIRRRREQEVADTNKKLSGKPKAKV
jgi:hypothetical protein